MKIQRDHGDRCDRRHARLKYTIEDRGVEWFKEELNQRLGWSLKSVRDFHLNQLQTGMVGTKMERNTGLMDCLSKVVVCGESEASC